MVDPGFVSGFIGAGIDLAIRQILEHINIALRCRKELSNLKDLVRRIEPIIKEIQHYRPDLNRRKIQNPQSNNNLGASAVNIWLKKLDTLLRQASAMSHQCTSTIPKFHVISRYKTSRRITRLISDITQHLQLVPLISLAQTQELQERLARVEELGTSPALATAPLTISQPDASRGFFINEPLVVGQHNAFATLKKLVIEAEAHSPFSRIGVLGKGGSGKTLLLKTVLNSKKVRDFFCDGLVLWLTVSQYPSFISLRNQLFSQIAAPDKNMNEEALKIWLYETMQGKRFLLFLDDVWEEGAKLLEELGLLRLTDHSNSKVVVSSRNHKALLEMGVNADASSLITMADLIEDDSWQLFAYHAFPYNNGDMPANIEERRAKVLCAKCGGLPLALKAVGRAMAGIIDAQEWDLAVQRLPNPNIKDNQAIYDCLRLSYDALGNYNINLQLCFLYLSAAFPEDQIIYAEGLTWLWMGEGLLQDHAVHNPFQIGRIYVNILADRCLIEPAVRDIDGSVWYFRMHDVVRGLAIQIAEQEESFYCGVGKRSTTLDENECLGRTRILLNRNQLGFLPDSLRAPEIYTLLLNGNRDLREIPRRAIQSMISLKVLDLTATSIQSLPESVGCLKQLVCLRLVGVPMKKLPASLTSLATLQVLDLFQSTITELPSDIHKLRSLTYLSLAKCKELECLPCSISRLTSLQYLYICSSVWRKPQRKKQACIEDLGNLSGLRKLRLGNNGETIREGTLGRMGQMETLELNLTMMAGLPDDIINMSRLKVFFLRSSHIVKMENEFSQFQNLNHLKLWYCDKLEELSYLHNLKSLKKLDIIKCCKLKRFSKEFGEKGAFPKLEIFSLVELDQLEELPVIEESVMPMLKMFTMMLCEVLMIPKNYFSLKRLQKIRVYGCSMVLKNLEKLKEEDKTVELKGGDKNVDLVTISTISTKELVKRYWQVSNSKYGEFWCNEFYLFLQDIYRYGL